MYCHASGIALSQPTKYRNRYGAQLFTPDQRLLGFAPVSSGRQSTTG